MQDDLAEKTTYLVVMDIFNLNTFWTMTLSITWLIVLYTTIKYSYLDTMAIMVQVEAGKEVKPSTSFIEKYISKKHITTATIVVKALSSGLDVIVDLKLALTASTVFGGFFAAYLGTIGIFLALKERLFLFNPAEVVAIHEYIDII
jgi:hypothetical protein